MEYENLAKRTQSHDEEEESVEYENLAKRTQSPNAAGGEFMGSRKFWPNEPIPTTRVCGWRRAFGEVARLAAAKNGRTNPIPR